MEKQFYSKYNLFLFRISKFFEINEEPDGSRITLEKKEMLWDYPDKWTRVLDEFGYTIYDERNIIVDIGEDQFIADLEKYINFCSFIEDDYRFGFSVTSTMNKYFYGYISS